MSAPKENEQSKLQSIIDGYRPICLCNKIHKGAIAKAIARGANSFDKVRRMTGAGTGPCGAARCGSMVRGMLGEEVAVCRVCGWSIVKSCAPFVCPRCNADQTHAKT